MSERAIEMEGVDKTYRFFSLRNLRLELEPGQILGFVGPNGAGKSTTIRILMALVHQDAGDVRVLGRSMPREQAIAKRDIGYMSEDMRLYGGATLAWHLKFVASVHPHWDHDYAVTLELEIRALHGDHAHLRRDRQRSNRRELVPRLPVPDRDSVPDLLDDLQVHRAPVGVGNCEIAVHVVMHSIHGWIRTASLITPELWRPMVMRPTARTALRAAIYTVRLSDRARQVAGVARATSGTRSERRMAPAAGVLA